MSKKIIAGNWKQNGTLKSSISLTKKVLQAVKKKKYTHEIIDVIVAIEITLLNFNGEKIRHFRNKIIRIQPERYRKCKK